MIDYKMQKAVRASLTTIGRTSGRRHTVKLRAVIYKGDFYFSRHRPDSDWFRNALANTDVWVTYNNYTIRGIASYLKDQDTERTISQIKYPDDPRGHEKRVAIRVRPAATPHEL